MLKFQRLGRLTACLLLLCMAVALIPNQVSALPAAGVSAAPAAESTVCQVRYSPYYGSTVIGCLEDGTGLTVLAETNDFYRIDCYDMTGYIDKSQVSAAEDGGYYVNCSAGSSEVKTLAASSAQGVITARSDVRALAMEQLGVPYVAGGTTPRGFDCSGFTQYVFNNLGFDISRTCAAQLEDGVIISRDDLQCGDLIFFQNTTGYGHFASHVGIYIGNGQMIHAGSRGIAVVSLEEAYYTYHYLCARRVILSDVTGGSELPSVGISQNINSSFWRESSQTEDGLGNFFSDALASAQFFLYNGRAM